MHGLNLLTNLLLCDAQRFRVEPRLKLEGVGLLPSRLTHIGVVFSPSCGEMPVDVFLLTIVIVAAQPLSPPRPLQMCPPRPSWPVHYEEMWRYGIYDSWPAICDVLHEDMAHDSRANNALAFFSYFERHRRVSRSTDLVKNNE